MGGGQPGRACSDYDDLLVIRHLYMPCLELSSVNPNRYVAVRFRRDSYHGLCCVERT